MPPKRPIGTITGFELITTNDLEENTTPQSEHEYTLEDLYLQLKKLRDYLDLDRLTYIEGLITRHIHDFNNPHLDDLSKLGTSVLQELYNLWLSEGNTGEREEFLRVLFQYVKIADVITSLEGKALDQVPSVKSAAAMISAHNTSADAHDALFQTLFPGEEVSMTPTFVIDAMVGLPRDMEIVADTSISFIDEHGRLKDAPAGVIPIDYQFGEPTFPLTGEFTNEFLHTEAFDNPYWICENAEVAIDNTRDNLRKIGPMFVLVEHSSENPIEHILKCDNGIEVEANKLYTISLFVSARERHSIGIRIPGGFVGSYPQVHFNLEEKAIFINANADKTKLYGELHELHSGYYRVAVTFRPGSAGLVVPEIYVLDIYDGDSNYVGTDGYGIGIDAIEFNEGPIVPYVKSEDTPGICGQHTFRMPTGAWYNKDEGTLIVECNNSNPLLPSGPRVLYSIGDGANGMTVTGQYPTNHNRRFFFNGYDERSISMYGQWSPASARELVCFVHGYSQQKHLIGGFDGNTSEIVTNKKVFQNPKYLYLGTDRLGKYPFYG